jgi:hypothetical protein
MKSFLWTITITLLLPVLAQFSYADSISTFTTQANIIFSTNFGGDNQGAIFQAPEVSLRAFGDASCSWCGSGNFLLTPGSSLTPSIPNGGLDWVPVYGTVTIGGRGFGCGGENCSLFATGLTALRGFTFPTNGQNFTVTLPARINGPITGELDTGQLFNLQIPTGQLVLNFDFEANQDGGPAYYQLSQGVFTTPGFQPTPEPGTLGLMASGLAGILGIGLKTRNSKRLPN